MCKGVEVEDKGKERPSSGPASSRGGAEEVGKCAAVVQC